QLLARGREDVDARLLAAPGGGVDVAAGIDDHAVDAAALPEVVQHRSAPAAAVGEDVVGDERVRAVRPRGVVGDVEGLVVGREGDAVGRVNVVDHPRHLVGDGLAVGRLDAVDGVALLPVGGLAAVARVGEVDAPLPVEAQVVGRGQPFA